MTVNGVNFPVAALAEVSRRYGARQLSLFGSILRDDFTEASDVDILVEFFPETRIGLIGMGHMEAELSELIGRRVDLKTPDDLSRHFRNAVVGGARPLHAA